MPEKYAETILDKGRCGNSPTNCDRLETSYSSDNVIDWYEVPQDIELKLTYCFRVL